MDRIDETSSSWINRGLHASFVVFEIHANVSSVSGVSRPHFEMHTY